MSKATLFDAGTVGVDLKTNPLFLGKKKLHSATNLVFEEGVVKVRPGFTYEALGCVGVFQGVCEFFPKKGISTASFSDVAGGIAVAVGGRLYFNCKIVEGIEFPCHGNVNLFQAENYLIIQHEESETYWWDGVSGPVKSPGMQEQDWNDPETPTTELETVAPIADIPECEDTGGKDSGITLRMKVIDSVTEAPISGVYVQLDKNGNRAYKGVTDASGVVVFHPTPRTYEYLATKTGYTPLADQIISINGTATEVIFDACMPPMIILNGEVQIVVRLSSEEASTCGFTTAVVSGPTYTPPWAGGYVDVEIVNTGELPITINTALASWPSVEVFRGLPVIIPVGGSVTLSIGSISSDDIAGGSLQLLTTCGDSTVLNIDSASAYTVQNIGSSFDAGNDDWTSGAFEITNTGHSPLTIESVANSTGPVGVNWYQGYDSYTLPKTILPGESTYILVVELNDVGVGEEDPTPSWEDQSFTVTTDKLAPTEHAWLYPGTYPFLIPYGD